MRDTCACQKQNDENPRRPHPVLVSTVATAQDARGYIGGEIALFSYEEAVGPLSLSDETFAFRILGGVDVNETVSIEVGYGETDDL